METQMNVAVGQQVAVQSAFADREYSFGWVVTKVTPKTKRVTVERVAGEHRSEYTFDARGWEMNGNASSYHARLEPNVEMARAVMDAIAKGRAAATALGEVRSQERVRHTWGKAAMLEEVVRLEGLLMAARAAVEAIPESAP